MKIRKVVIIFTLILGLFMFVQVRQLNQYNIRNIDMVDINNRYQCIKGELSKNLLQINNDEVIKKLEQQYTCHIILNEQDDYQYEINKAIQQGDIMLDFEIVQLDQNVLSGKITFSEYNQRWEKMESQLKTQFIIIALGLAVIAYVLMAVLYYYYIKPFHKLHSFAGEVAKGNLDVPLPMKKNNYFGVFTESFDILREELKRARQNEYEANIRKKELVAELSHDMKTPLATIKATCEVLKAKFMIARTQNKRPELEIPEEEIPLNDYESKVSIIEHKVDTIDQLIGNMVHATLEELEVLKVEPVLEESTQIKQILSEIVSLYHVHIMNEIPQCLIYMDKLRFRQVVDNIINNSNKYARTDIYIKFEENMDGIIMSIRDKGPGVSEEDLPMLTSKFYRGQNAKGRDGAGLGLFLSQFFMEQMNGGFECFNDAGFVVNLFIKKA